MEKPLYCKRYIGMKGTDGNMRDALYMYIMVGLC